MEVIINLTQHTATEEQRENGVMDVGNSSLKPILVEALNFYKQPTRQDIEAAAKMIAKVADAYLVQLEKAGAEIDRSKREAKAMIGGAPYLMSALENYLNEMGIVPVYAYSERISEERHLEDGSVQKVNVFKHIGFIEY